MSTSNLTPLGILHVKDDHRSKQLIEKETKDSTHHFGSLFCIDLINYVELQERPNALHISRSIPRLSTTEALLVISGHSDRL